MTSDQGEGTGAGRAREGFPGGAHGGRAARRRYLVVTGAIAACAFVITIAAALSTGNDPSSAAPGIVAAVTQTSARLFVPSDSTSATPAPQLTDTATAEPTADPTATLVPTIDSAWSATPDVIRPAPTDVSDPVSELVASIEAQFGVRIMTVGQNWGSDETSERRNLGAVSTALAMMPAEVRAASLTNAGGLLTFLSNDTGSTEGGWQPYGARAANFYSNDDFLAGRQVAANQVVLQPGSTAQTIGHEMMHAYQLRAQAPGDYAGALITSEMKSFMQATGWKQLVSDDEARADAASWDSLNADFSYGGLSLAYLNDRGETSTLFTPNPLEAYAEAGGLYYAHSAGTTLPEWPEYWRWFSANVG